MRHYSYKIFKKINSASLIMILVLSYTITTHAVSSLKATKSAANLLSPDGMDVFTRFLMAETYSPKTFHSKIVRSDGEDILIVSRNDFSTASSPYNDSQKFTHLYYNDDGSVYVEKFQNISTGKEYRSDKFKGKKGKGIEITRSLRNPNYSSEEFLYKETYVVVKRNSGYYRVQMNARLTEGNDSSTPNLIEISLDGIREFEIRARPEMLGLSNIESGTKTLMISHVVNNLRAPPGFIESVRVEGSNVYVRIINEYDPKNPSLHEIKYVISNPTNQPLGEENSPELRFVSTKKLSQKELDKVKVEVVEYPPAKKINPKKANKNSSNLNSDISLSNESTGEK